VILLLDDCPIRTRLGVSDWAKTLSKSSVFCLTRLKHYRSSTSVHLVS
jgi:hypothetical protein